MLDDKLKATDWEATNEEIMELVARESYLQWIKDNENRNNSRNTYLNIKIKYLLLTQLIIATTTTIMPHAQLGILAR